MAVPGGGERRLRYLRVALSAIDCGAGYQDRQGDGFPRAENGDGSAADALFGLAFGKDGTHLYAVFDSLTAPQGNNKDQTGNAVAVYGFSDGR
jgi:hypothetical protein